MRSDILKDGMLRNIHSPLTEDAKKRQEELDQEARNIRASMGLDFLGDSDITPDIDASTDELNDIDDFDGAPAFLLMPHERKLPIAMQRQLVMARRRTGDDIDENDAERFIIESRKNALQREHSDHLNHPAQILRTADMVARTIDADIDADVNSSNDTSGGTRVAVRIDINADGDSGNSNSTSGGSRIEKTAAQKDAVTTVAKLTEIESKNSDGSTSSTGGGTRIE